LGLVFRASFHLSPRQNLNAPALPPICKEKIAAIRGPSPRPTRQTENAFSLTSQTCPSLRLPPSLPCGAASLSIPPRSKSPQTNPFCSGLFLLRLAFSQSRAVPPPPLGPLPASYMRVHINCSLFHLSDYTARKAAFATPVWRFW